MEKLVLKDREFDRIVDIVNTSSGIFLSDQKKDLVVNRVLKRLKVLGLVSFSEYISYLETNTDSELESLIDAITTNLTYFFREVHHFDHLEKVVLPEFYKNEPGGTFRIYSAGCSSGEEIFTSAIICERFKRVYPLFNYKLFGVDIDNKMIKFARDGIYAEDSVVHIGDSDRRLIFDKGTGDNEGFYRIKKSIAANISFSRQSILDAPPTNNPLDIIFCRNVLIYFDNDSQVEALHQFKKALKPNGILFLGHSENMVGKQDVFRLDTRTMYRPI